MLLNPILVLFSFIINNIKCYIVFPVEVLPKENYKTNYELNSPKDIISKEFINSFFTVLEIGTPIQRIPLLIKQKINDYIITSSHKMENAERNYTEKLIYDFSPNFLQKYKYFDENSSSSFLTTHCEKRKPYDESEKPIAEVICISKRNNIPI